MIGSFLYGNTLRDFLRVRRVLPWLVVVVALYALGRVFVRITPHQSLQDAYVMLSSIIVYRLLALAAAIFATAVISQEVEQKTIVYLLTRPVPRPVLLLSRLLAAVTVVALIACLSAVATSYSIFGRWSDLLSRDLVALIAGAFAYTALFTFVSLMLNRAMIFCLIFAFGWEAAVPNMPGDTYLLSVNSYVTAIGQHPSPGGPENILEKLGGLTSINTISVGTAWTILILLVAFCLIAGAWWFRHFEYLPREDAE